MGKLLRTTLILGLISSFLLTVPASPVRAEPPINPGIWTGYFTRDIEITNLVSGVLIEATGNAKGDLNLVVSTDGSVTGKIENYQGEFGWVITPASLSPGGHCTFSGAFDVTGGNVTMSPTLLPFFDLQIKTTERIMDCDPEALGGPDTNPTHSVQFEASTNSGGKITGNVFRFENDMIDTLMKDMALVGAQMTVHEYWELNTSAATIQQPIPDYIEYFLQNVEFMNTYKTSVDWHDSTPGIVNFTLANWTQEGVLDEPYYSAALELGKLTSGKNPLTVTAIGADGLPKDSQSMDVIIVPQEPWAQKAGFTFAETVPSDIFKVAIYRGKTFIPKEPIKLPYLDLSFIPVIGGKWGMEKPFQVVVNLEATSMGGLSNPAPITGEGSLFLGDVDHPLKLTVDGQTVTNMTESALLFDQGNMSFKSTPLSFTRSVGMIDLVPAAQALYKIPVLGKIIEFINALGLGIDLTLTTQAKGQGDLGVTPDKSDLIFTNGSITPSIAISAKAGIFPDPIKIAVGGGGKGTFQIRIAPSTGLENCWVSIKFTVSGFGQVFDSPDYGIAQCAQAMLGGRKVLAVYLPPNILTAYQSVSTLSQTPLLMHQNTPAMQTPPTTILASGISSEASLDLSSDSDGRLAFVYSTAQQGQLSLRIFDGQAWGEPILFGDTNRINLDPVVAFDASGQILVAWVTSAVGSMPSVDEYAQFFRSWNVSYAVFDKTGEVIKQESLTTDDIPDYDLQLERSSDGTLWLAWLKSPSIDLWGSLEDPNWLQSASWDVKGWSSIETVSKKLVGAIGMHMAAGTASDVSIVASQDMDGDPQTITDLEINLYQHSGTKWKAAQALTNDEETDVFPHVAYASDGRLVIAWKRGDVLVGLDGDLKAASSTWDIGGTDLTPDLIGGELFAGAGGELAFLWSGFTENGQGVWLAHRPSPDADWLPANSLVDGLEGVGMVSSQLNHNGDFWVGLSQLHVPDESQDVPGLGQVSIPGLPTSSDLVVLQAAGVMQPASENEASQGNSSPLNLASSRLSPFLIPGIAAILGLVLLVGVVALVRKRATR